MAKLNVVVPMYNIENYIERCLNSIKGQTFSDFICYVVSDGSKDNSINIAKKFIGDDRFVVLEKENGGLSDARNYGLKRVDSEYVMFVDGDDYLEPNCFEECIRNMDKDRLDILVFSYNQYYLETGKKEPIHLKIKDGIYSLKDYKELLFETPNAAWNKMYRTKLFKDNGIEYPFGSRYEDLGTTPKLLYLADKIGYIDMSLYNYIIDRPNNITTQIDAKLYQMFDMCKEIIDYYKKENIFEEYKLELNCLIERNLILTLRKVMTMKDKKFVNEFIDYTFDFRKEHFGNIKQRYPIKNSKDDEIYMNKTLCKLYYLYKTVKG